jgi:hypothetical protein
MVSSSGGAADGWDSAHFWHFPELRQFSVSEPPSPQPPLTQAVGRLAIVIKPVEILEHVYYNFC